MSKSELRRKLLSKLNQIGFEELIVKSGALSERFHDWAKIFHKPDLYKKTLMSFCPFGCEPQIQVESTDLVEAAKIPYEVAYPRIENWSGGGMSPRLARRDLPGQWEEFELPSGNKIYQPTESQPLCSLANIAAILVPGLGFSTQGERLGRGGGFYDRFLAQIPDALRVGIAFEMQLVQSLPSQDHDLPVDIILTESRLIETIRYSQWKNHARIERE